MLALQLDNDENRLEWNGAILLKPTVLSLRSVSEAFQDENE